MNATRYVLRPSRRWQMAWHSQSLEYMMNVLYDERRRAEDVERVHNAMANEGRQAWLTNLTLSSAYGAVRYMEVGTGSAAVSVLDTDLDTLSTQYENIQSFLVGTDAHFMLWLKSDSENGNTLTEAGLRFDDDSGVHNTVEDRLFNRFLHTPLEKTKKIEIIYHVTVSLSYFRWAGLDFFAKGAEDVPSDTSIFDLGARVITSKLVDPSLYGPLSALAVGDYIQLDHPMQDTADYLYSERVRKTSPTITVGPGTLTMEATITSAENPRNITEAGAAISGTPGQDVLWHISGFTFDNSAADADVSMTLALRNYVPHTGDPVLVLHADDLIGVKADSATLSGGDWLDQTARIGIDVEAGAPVFHESGGPNGHAYVSYGASDRAKWTLPAAVPHPYTEFLVFRKVGSGDGTISDGIEVGHRKAIYESGGTIQIGAGNIAAVESSTPYEDQWVLLGIEWNGDATRVFRSGVLIATVDAGAQSLTGVRHNANHASGFQGTTDVAFGVILPGTGAAAFAVWQSYLLNHYQL